MNGETPIIKDIINKESADSPEQAAGRSAEQPSESAAEGSAEQPSEGVAEGSAEQAPESAAEGSAEQPPEGAAEGSAEQPLNIDRQPHAENVLQESAGQENTSQENAGQENTPQEDTRQETVSQEDAPQENAGDAPAQPPQKKRLRIVLLCVLGVLLAAAVILYFVAADHFKTHFLPNVAVNGMDCSYLDGQTVVSMLRDQSMGYSLTVTGQGDEQIGVLTAEDVGLTIDVQEDVDALLAGQAYLKWPWVFRSEASYTIDYEIDFDPELLEDTVSRWEALLPANMEKPKDAYLTEYLPEKKAYEVVEETQGSQLDIPGVYSVLEEAVRDQETAVNLEEADCYIRAAVTSEDSGLQKKARELNRLVGTNIVYDWNGREIVLDGDTIHEWIIEDGDQISVDEEAVAEFVKSKAAENDTYGKKRNFTTVAGTTLSLRSGAYGWKTDCEQETEELVKLIKKGAQEEREPIYSKKAARKGTKDDIGDSYVEIDLSGQHLYLFIDGEIVLESDFVSGNMSNGNATPAGVFGLTYKTRNAVLRGANYETPVNYWMPFNGNVGMHDATWRGSFGGDIYLTDGSHGCVNLPLQKAKEIYEYVSTGFPVICYY